MRTQRKFLALLMALCLMISMMPMAAFADGDEDSAETPSGMGKENAWNVSTEGSTVTAYLTENEDSGEDTTYTLTISGNGAMKDYESASERPWNSNAESITSIVVENGVTHIGARAFEEFKICESISFPASLSSIDEKALGNMEALETITVDENNTNYKIKNGVLFSNDETLLLKYPAKKEGTSYTVEDGVQRIGLHAFSYAKSLETVTFPSSSLTSIGDFAFDSSGIKSAVVPDSVGSIGTAFVRTASMETITLGTGITELEASAFYGTGAKTITFAEGSQLKSIGQQAFWSVSSLETINIPSTIETIGYGAFAGCSSLRSVAADGVNFTNLTSIGQKAFQDCTTLTSFPMVAGTPISLIDKNTFTKDITLESIVIPDSVSEIGESAFYNCTELETVSISPNSLLEKIGENSLRNTAITSLYLPKGVNSVGLYATLGCNALAVVDLSAAGDNISWANTFWVDANNSPCNRIYYFSSDTQKNSALTNNVAGINTNYSIYAITNGGTFTDVDALKGDMSDTPVQKGFLFEGWSTDKDAESGSTTGNFSTNQTYYAIWAECETHEYGDPAWSWSDDYNIATATFTCVKCGDEVEENATISNEETTAPTCTEPGEITYTAAVTFNNTNYVSIETSQIPANGHTWDEGKVTTPTTSSTSGEKTYTCTVCGATKTETIPATGSSHSSSSSSSTTYAVSVDTAKNGTVSVSPKNASKGTTVTITAKPNDGYEVDEVIVTDKNGDTVKVTAKGNDKYTFVMPAGKVDVEVTFVKEYVAPAISFTDVKSGAWYYDAAIYAAENGLMSGTGNGAFSPDLTTSRAMIWTILARVDGQNISVTYGNWYDKAQSWAMAAGVSDGTNPDNPITREQLAVMLYGFAKEQGYTTSNGVALSRYVDASDVSAWAVEALEWAVGNGLISSMGNNILAPTGTATRAQVAVILMNFCENIAK